MGSRTEKKREGAAGEELKKTPVFFVRVEGSGCLLHAVPRAHGALAEQGRTTCTSTPEIYHTSFSEVARSTPRWLQR